MTINFEQFISQFSQADWVQVVKDAEILGNEGSIGECRMRQIADAWSANCGLPNHRAIDTIIREGYRQLALEHIKASERPAPEHSKEQIVAKLEELIQESYWEEDRAIDRANVTCASWYRARREENRAREKENLRILNSLKQYFFGG